MYRIAVFASGNGSNAQRIIEYFDHHPQIKVEIILSNNPAAYVLERAKKLGIPSFVFNRHEFYESDIIPDFLAARNINYIVLAGFLWLVPVNILRSYDHRIINIHPALLPKYGGKGMYGMKVHEAAISAGDPESGITIHFVNEKYDNGAIIFQAKCEISKGDTPNRLAEKIHQLEYRYFPEIIEQVLTSKA
ncbi:MAG: phosphoribosylglycinamide formyltransferase [Bacteroidales bacterium]|nr:phosphoribosylglycinamide formyltransferase [Bacteroidales bacterium]MDD4602569.1 phosphoribosylglycinamide formyltransferase [Bacteroidales bacterium]